MNIGIIGCGYVFDHYMSTFDLHPQLSIVGIADRDSVRLAKVSKEYQLKAFSDNAALINDPLVEIVVNLTNIESHYEVNKQVIEAGKHLYCEKPFTTSLHEADELFELATKRGVFVSAAPSNFLSRSVQTLARAVHDGAVGDVRIVYAEFDDNVIYRMYPETWRSATGAPWPYIHEYEQGCTYEHVGYHLTWLCAIFGPVERVTAFSAVTAPDKFSGHDIKTPDFSVGCLYFKSGVVARVTCSIGVPLDHRLRIYGNEGALTVDTYRDYWCPVYLERYSQLGLNARKARLARSSRLLQWLTGIGGRRLPLVDETSGIRGRGMQRPRPLSLRPWLHWIKRRQLGQQDKVLGIVELAAAIRENRPAFPPPDFILHITELTIAIQGAGLHSATHEMKTSFIPDPAFLRTSPGTTRFGRPTWLERRSEAMLVRMHRH